MNNIAYNNRKALAEFVRTTEHVFHMNNAYTSLTKPTSRACIGAMAAALWPEVATASAYDNNIVTWSDGKLALKLDCTLAEVREITMPAWMNFSVTRFEDRVKAKAMFEDRVKAAAMLDEFAEHDLIKWNLSYA